MTGSLRLTTTETYQVIYQQIAAVTAEIDDHSDRPDIIAAVDQCIISACQHQTAVCEILLPLVQHSTSRQSSHVAEYVHQARVVEQIAAFARARMYGAAQARHTPWAQVWNRFEAEIRTLQGIEQALVDALDTRLDAVQQERVVDQLQTAALAAPTRPHPHSPHRGRFAHLTRTWWTRADRIWDVTQGRGASRDAS